MTNIASLRPHLERRLMDHRVVFWHDPEGQYATDLGSLALPGVTVIRVANDEYAVKYRLLQEQPVDKFLVYRSGPVPAGVGNWLLDLELAYGIFTADRSSLLSQDLGLTAEGIDAVVAQHEKFFNAGKRVESLKALLAPEDDAARLRAKMSAVTLGQKEHSLLEITRTLLIEKSKGQRAKYGALVDQGLDGPQVGSQRRLQPLDQIAQRRARGRRLRQWRRRVVRQGLDVRQDIPQHRLRRVQQRGIGPQALFQQAVDLGHPVEPGAGVGAAIEAFAAQSAAA